MNKALRESEVLEQNTNVELQWKALRMVVYKTAEKLCEKPKRKHQDWFDKTDKHLNVLLKQRSNAKINMLQTRTRSIKSKYTASKRNLQQYTRKVKSDWWEKKAKSLQHAADTIDMKSFYGRL